MADEERISRMRRAMEAERLDALVLRLPENVLLLSGFWPMVGATVLLFPVDGTPVCTVPDCFEPEAGPVLQGAVLAAYYRYGALGGPEPGSELMRILGGLAKQARWNRIGYEGNFERIAAPWNSAEAYVPASQTRALFQGIFGGSELADASALLQSQRARKTASEIAKLRTVNEISCIGLEAFARRVQPGISGVELLAEVEREIMILGTGSGGASRVRAYAQVATGPEETALAHRPSEIPTHRALRAGDVALLELAVVADGYWADRTRARAAGQANDEALKISRLVDSAQHAALAVLRPGVTGAEVDEAARSVIREAGYGDFFPHITGHGLGFCYHEATPRLARGSGDRIEEGMVVSVEPGVYVDVCGGIRIEDNVVITERGAEILGPFPKDLV
jgi:Xaa-Pro dipeptidase